MHLDASHVHRAPRHRLRTSSSAGLHDSIRPVRGRMRRLCPLREGPDDLQGARLLLSRGSRRALECRHHASPSRCRAKSQPAARYLARSRAHPATANAAESPMRVPTRPADVLHRRGFQAGATRADRVQDAQSMFRAIAAEHRHAASQSADCPGRSGVVGARCAGTPRRSRAHARANGRFRVARPCRQYVRCRQHRLQVRLWRAAVWSCRCLMDRIWLSFPGLAVSGLHRVRNPFA